MEDREMISEERHTCGDGKVKCDNPKMNRSRTVCTNCWGWW